MLVSNFSLLIVSLYMTYNIKVCSAGIHFFKFIKCKRMIILLSTLIQNTWRYTSANISIIVSQISEKQRLMSLISDMHQNPSRDKQHLFKNLAGTCCSFVSLLFAPVMQSITLKVLSIADAQMPTS